MVSPGVPEQSLILGRRNRAGGHRGMGSTRSASKPDSGPWSGGLGCRTASLTNTKLGWMCRRTPVSASTEEPVHRYIKRTSGEPRACYDRLKWRRPARPGRNVRMPVHLYALAICFLAAVLFVAINNFEPNPRLALVLKFLILVVSAAAIASRLTP